MTISRFCRTMAPIRISSLLIPCIAFTVGACDEVDPNDSGHECDHWTETEETWVDHGFVLDHNEPETCPLALADTAGTVTTSGMVEEFGEQSTSWNALSIIVEDNNNVIVASDREFTDDSDNDGWLDATYSLQYPAASGDVAGPCRDKMTVATEALRVNEPDRWPDITRDIVLLDYHFDTPSGTTCSTN